MLASLRILLSQNQPQNQPKPPAKGDAQGKKKKHVQHFTMCYSLTKKGFISKPVDPYCSMFSNCACQFLVPNDRCSEYFVAYVSPLLVCHHLRFKPPEDGLHFNQVAVRKQHPCPSKSKHLFRQFLVIYRCLDKGGGEDTLFISLTL